MTRLCYYAYLFDVSSISLIMIGLFSRRSANTFRRLNNLLILGRLAHVLFALFLFVLVQLLVSLLQNFLRVHFAS